MIRIAICDDEHIYTAKIKNKVKDILYEKGINNYEIDLFHSGIELSELKHDISKYHIVFLDINMGEQNGLETAKNIRKYDEDIFIVFISAFLNYSPACYKYNAFRFILKDSLSEMHECIEAILKEIRIKSSKKTINFTGGKREIFVDEIIYIESDRHKLHFTLKKSKNKDLSLYGKLDDFEEEFKDYDFIRIHKSYLINMRLVKNIKAYEAIMNNGDSLPIPRSKYMAIKERFIINGGTCL